MEHPQLVHVLPLMFECLHGFYQDPPNSSPGESDSHVLYETAFYSINALYSIIKIALAKAAHLCSLCLAHVSLCYHTLLLNQLDSKPLPQSLYRLLLTPALLHDPLLPSGILLNELIYKHQLSEYLLLPTFRCLAIFAIGDGSSQELDDAHRGHVRAVQASRREAINHAKVWGQPLEHVAEAVESPPGLGIAVAALVLPHSVLRGARDLARDEVADKLGVLGAHVVNV